jgi:tRNA G18 (ribose-2'-O)-methylase SpoU
MSIAAAVVTDSTDHISLDWTRPTLLMFGSEAHGLGSELLSAADSRVTIPMANGVESLNISVSAGIFLYEAVRQNRTN